jgi:hypothetical protein
MDISNGEPLLITLDYQQWHTCNGSETITDDSYEPLQMTFSVVVSSNHSRIETHMFFFYLFDFVLRYLSLSNYYCQALSSFINLYNHLLRKIYFWFLSLKSPNLYVPYVYK